MVPINRETLPQDEQERLASRDPLEDWTPAVGWRIALGKVAFRSLLIAPILASAMTIPLYVPWFALRLIGLAGAVVGGAAGWLMGGGDLVDNTGIEAKYLSLLVVAAIAIVAAIECGLASMFLEGGFDVRYRFAMGSASLVAALVAAGKVAAD